MLIRLLERARDDGCAGDQRMYMLVREPQLPMGKAPEASDQVESSVRIHSYVNWSIL